LAFSCFAALPEIGDVFRRLLLADAREVNELELRKLGLSGDEVFSAPIFAYLAERYQSLRSVILEQLVLDEDHIRVLGDISRPGFEIELKLCQIEGVAAETHWQRSSAEIRDRPDFLTIPLLQMGCTETVV
jgi:hypothetical protein